VEETPRPVPVVKALTTIDWPMPVVRPEYVCKNWVPASDAVEERSRSTPVVVEVSMEVEDILASDPPEAMTDVV